MESLGPTATPPHPASTSSHVANHSRPRSPSPDGGSTSHRDPDKRETKRKRKTYSCTACYKLKAKCDREAPCGKCVQRHCQATCSLVTGRDSDESNRSAAADAEPAAAPVQVLDPTPSAPSVHFADIVNPYAPLQPPPQEPPTWMTNLSPPPPPPTAKVVVSAPKEPASGTVSEDEDDERESGGIGTLVLDEDGRARYVGPTAGSEWLKEPDGTESVTPYVHERSGLPSLPHNNSGSHSQSSMFPFSPSGLDSLSIMTEALQALPEREEAKALTECFHRHVGWNYTIIDRTTFEDRVDTVYAAKASLRGVDVHPHQLALIFAVLAVGVQFNLELAPNDPLSHRYCFWARQSLAVGDFLTKNTLLGVQAVHVLGHFYLSTDRRGDSSWPLWGLSMRMIQAMGLHRDGVRWNLPPETVEERRRVFWECHTADVLQANCFSRPNTIQPDYFDTQFPESTDGVDGQDSFSILKFKLAEIAVVVLQQVTKVKAPSYRSIQSLWKKLCELEASTPFYMRCRPAWLAVVSLSQPVNAPPLTTPEIQRHNFRLTFQQHMLAMNTCEVVLSLQRPFFTRALCQSPLDLSASRYYASVIAVFERCIALSAILQSVQELYPQVAARQWSFYYHTFTAAVCLSTLVILSPTSHLAPFALQEIQTIIGLFAATPSGSRPHYNLDSLVKMQQRAQERFSSQAPPPKKVLSQISTALGVTKDSPTAGSTTSEHEDAELDHVTMMGWDTRLVQRLKSGVHHSAVSVHKGRRTSSTGPATSSSGVPTSDPFSFSPAPNFYPDLQAEGTSDAGVFLGLPSTDPLASTFWNADQTNMLDNLAPPVTAEADWAFWTELFQGCN